MLEKLKVHRRHLLMSAAAFAIQPLASVSAQPARRRVRPTDAAWPTPERWEKLNEQLEGNLIEMRHLAQACVDDAMSSDCTDLLGNINNPYFLGDEPSATQISGWLDAWTPAPSAYTVSARRAEDVAAAVNFARENNLRLVVKGGGHSYQGTSNAADSLLIWTRDMNRVELHKAFVAKGCADRMKPSPAVTIGAGAVWMDAYHAVTTLGGRYVQGGGCATVGVAGLIQSGGFGTYSKCYGMAAAGLLEAEIVTADGQIRTVNPCMNADLFWAIKGGGGGSWGVITKLTLRTRDLPEYFGAVHGMIAARSDEAYRRLLGRFFDFYAEKLMNPHWESRRNSGATVCACPWNVRVSMNSKLLKFGRLFSAG